MEMKAKLQPRQGQRESPQTVFPVLVFRQDILSPPKEETTRPRRRIGQKYFNNQERRRRRIIIINYCFQFAILIWRLCTFWRITARNTRQSRPTWSMCHSPAKSWLYFFITDREQDSDKSVSFFVSNFFCRCPAVNNRKREREREREESWRLKRETTEKKTLFAQCKRKRMCVVTWLLSRLHLSRQNLLRKKKWRNFRIVSFSFLFSKFDTFEKKNKYLIILKTNKIYLEMDRRRVRLTLWLLVSMIVSKFSFFYFFFLKL
jgi:hypothetical protein